MEQNIFKGSEKLGCFPTEVPIGIPLPSAFANRTISEEISLIHQNISRIPARKKQMTAVIHISHYLDRQK